MRKRKSFIRGILVGIALVAVLDIPIVHWLLGFHRAYEHHSVNIVEPIAVLLAVVILSYFSYQEFRNPKE